MLFLMVWGMVCLAQRVTGKSFSGMVVDEYGDPLIGVAVRVTEHKEMGVVTDDEGRFSLSNVPLDAKSLTLSYVGMKA